MPTRLSRAEQVERNRELVLDAARQVFLARGYTGATLDAIADEAGFSKGVVYSQFAGKPDLFLALLDRRVSERAAENAGLVAGKAGLPGMVALLDANARRSEGALGWSGLLIEFRVIAARDPDLNRRYAAVHARALDGIASELDAVLTAGGLVPVFPPRKLAELILAIDVGLVLERATDAGAFSLSHMKELAARLVEPACPIPSAEEPT